MAIILSERQGLLIEYPRRADEDTRSLLWFPLYGPTTAQIRFTESKQARTVSYDVINRNTTLYTHLGAKSRTMTLEFFLAEDPSQVPKPKPIDGTGNLDHNLTKAQIDALAGGAATKTPRISPGLTKIKPAERDKFFVKYPDSKRTPHGAQRGAPISFRQYFMDVFRTIVTTDSQNTVLGPPLIRIKWHDLYRSPLFICTQVDFPLGDKADQFGYGPDGFPEFIPVKLMLEEVRSTDNITFKPNDLKLRDGIPGWESVLDGRGYDPGDVDGV